MRYSILLTCILWVLCITACAAKTDPGSGFGDYQAYHQPNPAGSHNYPDHPGDFEYIHVRNQNEGSLWNPYNSRAFMFSDNKARNVNDIITVNIMELADASRNATTQLSRKSGMDSNVSEFFGSPLDFGMDNLYGTNTGAATAAERTRRPFRPELITDSQNDFSGSGRTVRNDRLVATISARVVAVYPNGNMRIAGRREVTINNEKQYITISGIVRQEDVQSNNTVLSSAIADAQISISGKGVISDKQSPGFGHRVFDFIWPF